MSEETGTSGRRIDWGRIVMVPVAVLFGGVALQHLWGIGGDGDGAVSRTSAALTAAFYVLLIWAYLRRGPASATSSVTGAVIAAPVATFLPFGMSFLGDGGAAPSAVLVGDALLVAGLAWSVWALRSLDRSLSVVPQARELVQSGPYAWVRHPLYLGELVAMLGLALTLGGALPLVAWVVLVALQAYRAVQEERLLGDALPGYAEYRNRTARIVPAVF